MVISDTWLIPCARWAVKRQPLVTFFLRNRVKVQFGDHLDGLPRLMTASFSGVILVFTGILLLSLGLSLPVAGILCTGNPRCGCCLLGRRCHHQFSTRWLGHSLVPHWCEKHVTQFLLWETSFADCEAIMFIFWWFLVLSNVRSFCLVRSRGYCWNSLWQNGRVSLEVFLCLVLFWFFLNWIITVWWCAKNKAILLESIIFAIKITRSLNVRIPSWWKEPLLPLFTIPITKVWVCLLAEYITLFRFKDFMVSQSKQSPCHKAVHSVVRIVVENGSLMFFLLPYLVMSPFE